jgi:hypothetical protein
LRSDEELKSRQPLVAPSSQNAKKAEASNTPSKKDRESGARTRGKLKNAVAEAKNEVADAKKKLAKQEEEICELKNHVKSLTAILLRATEKVVRTEDFATSLLGLSGYSFAAAADSASNCSALAEAHAALKKLIAAEEIVTAQRNAANEHKIAALDQLVSELRTKLASALDVSGGAKPAATPAKHPQAVAPELEAVHSILPVQASVDRGSVPPVQAQIASPCAALLPSPKALTPSPSVQTVKPSLLTRQRLQQSNISTPVSFLQAFPSLSSPSSAYVASRANTSVAAAFSSSKHPVALTSSSSAPSIASVATGTAAAVAPSSAAALSLTTKNSKTRTPLLVPVVGSVSRLNLKAHADTPSSSKHLTELR